MDKINALIYNNGLLFTRGSASHVVEFCLTKTKDYEERSQSLANKVNNESANMKILPFTVLMHEENLSLSLIHQSEFRFIKNLNVYLSRMMKKLSRNHYKKDVQWSLGDLLPSASKQNNLLLHKKYIHQAYRTALVSIPVVLIPFFSIELYPGDTDNVEFILEQLEKKIRSGVFPSYEKEQLENNISYTREIIKWWKVDIPKTLLYSLPVKD